MNFTNKELNRESIINEISGWSPADLRQFINRMFDTYIQSKDWETFSEDYKSNCAVNRCVLNDFFDNIDALERKELISQIKA